MKEIVFGNIRVQLLSDSIIRIEYGKNGKFCNENTFFIPDRQQFGNSDVAFAQEGNTVISGQYRLHIRENAKSLAGVRLEKGGECVYSYKKLKNCGELPPLDRTPEVFAVSDTPRIFAPDGGYSVERKGEYRIEEGVQDVYLLLCGGDAKKLRRLYAALTGRTELVRLSTLGGWNSKYYAYSEEEAKRVILNYEKYNVPLDVMVIDTDWRSCEHGWGYDINTKLFPDMKRFIGFAHSHGVEICFNDHPEPKNAANVFAAEEIAYRESNLQALMKKGLDIWWYDRNWTTHLISPVKDVRFETLGLYLFSSITENFYRKAAADKYWRRPDIMGNVVNVRDGKYEKISDTASHRYSLQWTGDTTCEAKSVSQEIATLIRAGNNLIAYCSADCGGHIGNPDKELFIRWMQFGTLSPIFRPHCTCTVTRWRDPWAYDEEALDIVREYNNLRYRLLPVIYKNAYNNYLTGEPVFKSLGWEYPSDKRTLKLTDQYMLGNNIIIKPVAGKALSPDSREPNRSKVRTYLPAGEWLDPFNGRIYSGGRTVSREYGLREMPLFVRLGAIIPLAYTAKNTKEQKWDRLVYDFYPCKEASDEGYIYEDDAETVAYKYGKLRKSDFCAHFEADKNAYVITLSAAKGGFEGAKAFSKREITVKYHIFDGAERIKKVTVNGKDSAFSLSERDVSAFPLDTAQSASDGDVAVAKFNADIDKDYEIIFYLN